MPVPAPIEFWTFTVANLFHLVVGIALAVLSGQAYRRSGRRSFQTAAIGFLLITVSAVGDASYEVGIRAGYQFTSKQLLVLHTVESVFIGVGLAALFYSIRQY